MKKAERIEAARIQRAVSGYQIPMMSIPALYKRLKAAIAEGHSDERLSAMVGEFDGVVKVAR